MENDGAATATAEREHYLSGPQAAARAGVSLPTIIAWCKRHPALGVQVGGRWRVSPSELERVCRGEVALTKRAQAA